jgi:hypothetical protein
MRRILGSLGLVMLLAGAMVGFDSLNRHYRWVEMPALIPDSIIEWVEAIGPAPTAIEDDSPPDADAIAAEDALKADSPDALQAYLSARPQGRFREAVAGRIAQLESVDDASAWNRAVAKDSEQAYQAYLKERPNGRFRTLASRRIERVGDDEGRIAAEPPIHVPASVPAHLPEGTRGSAEEIPSATAEPSSTRSVEPADSAAASMPFAVNKPNAMNIGEREEIKLIIDARENADPAAALAASTSGEVVSDTVRIAPIYGAQLAGGRCFDISPAERLDQAVSTDAAMEWSWLVKARVEGKDCDLTLTVSAVSGGVPRVLQRKEITLPVAVTPARVIEGLLSWADPLDDLINVIAALITLLGAVVTWVGFRARGA